jgi:hypothetical protein
LFPGRNLPAVANDGRELMRKLAITLAALSTLAVAAVAGAALPTHGAFAGTTSLRPINGFSDIVTFNAALTGKTLKKFQFGTLGCFGTGAFPVGTDPYGQPEALATIKSITIGTNGTFTVTSKQMLPGAPNNTMTTAVVTGTFTTPTKLSGTIQISQSSNGDVCGPTKMKFTAQPGTPSSLGLNG